jgi:hypothetical protein
MSSRLVEGFDRLGLKDTEVMKPALPRVFANGTKLTWPAWSAMSGAEGTTEVTFRGRQVAF